jgi:tryptophan 2,3-dioxygenase
MDKNIKQKIYKLGEKYATSGQDLNSYLEGLLYADYLSYWDYIHLDTLLSLQSPKTDFPDENVFIIYHQITELYFKLIINELEQITNNGRNVLASGEDLGWHKEIKIDSFIESMKRIIRYFENLVNSFDIMTDGMHKEEFLKFRMALLPGSGFQSVQFRLIEIYSTELKNLCHPKSNLNKGADLLENIYWQSGAKEVKTKKKTYTLTQFNKKYSTLLLKKIKELKNKNIYKKINSINHAGEKAIELKKLLKKYDLIVNVDWKLAHYKSAIKYLKNPKDDIKATGGTNWKKYLPPKFQKIIFFPKLWTKKEKENWGASWVLENYK